MTDSYVTQERCEYCDNGWVDGDPIATPEGPHYPQSRCAACSGDGWVIVESHPITEGDFEEAFG